MKSTLFIAVLAFSLASSRAADSLLLQQGPPSIDLSAPTTVAVGFKAKPLDISGATPVPETVASAAILAFGFLLIMRRRSA